MNRSEVTELHFLSPLQNVRSIMERGILCHAHARALADHVSVASEEVQARRAEIRVPGGRRLHEYANLYFNGRNAMLYLLEKQGHHLCILRISSNVLDLPGVVVTDQNAARGAVRFEDVAAGLARLDRELVFARYWNHDDPMERDRHKGIMQAEVLVPDHVPSRFITGAYVSYAADKIRLNRDVPELDVVVDSSRFFVAGSGRT